MKPSPEVTVVWAALNVAHRTIHRAMNAELKANGLPSLQWYDVLWELDRAEHGMRLRMWEIYGPLIQKHVGKIAEAHDAKEVGSALNSLFDAELRRPRQ